MTVAGICRWINSHVRGWPFVGGVAADALCWLVRAVGTLIGWAVSGATHAIDDVIDGVRGTVSGLTQFADWIGQIAQSTERWISVTFPQLYNQLRGDASGLLKGAESAVGSATSWVLHEAEAEISSARAWVVRDVFDPLVHDLDVLRHDAASLADGAEHEAVSVVKGLYGATIGRVVGLVGGAWRWIDRTAAPLIHLVELAEHWLVFFVTLPLDLGEALVQLIREGPRGFERSLAGNFSGGLGHQLEDVVAKWLGE